MPEANEWTVSARSSAWCPVASSDPGPLQLPSRSVHSGALPRARVTRLASPRHEVRPRLDVDAVDAKARRSPTRSVRNASSSAAGVADRSCRAAAAYAESRRELARTCKRHRVRSARNGDEHQIASRRGARRRVNARRSWAEPGGCGRLVSSNACKKVNCGASATAGDGLRLRSGSRRRTPSGSAPHQSRATSSKASASRRNARRRADLTMPFLCEVCATFGPPRLAPGTAGTSAWLVWGNISNISTRRWKPAGSSVARSARVATLQET
jgi:hypothetical protein